MKRFQPPKWSTWLLAHIVSNEPLLGDLAEGLESGRLGGWYWRQVLVVVLRACLSAKFAIFRWFAALPVGLLAAETAQRLVVFFARRSITVSYSPPVAGIQPEPIYNHNLFLAWMAITAFLMAAAFVNVSVSIVPGHKDVVARVAVSMVAVLSTGVIIMMIHSGQPVREPIGVAVCAIVGGTTGRLRFPRQV